MDQTAIKDEILSFRFYFQITSVKYQILLLFNLYNCILCIYIKNKKGLHYFFSGWIEHF